MAMIYGADTFMNGIHGIANRLRDKGPPKGTPIQYAYSGAIHSIAEKDRFGIEKKLDVIYYTGEVITSCATVSLSAKAIMVAVKSTEVPHTVRVIDLSSGYIRYTFEMVGGASVMEASGKILKESISIVIEFFSYGNTTDNASRIPENPLPQ